MTESGTAAFCPHCGAVGARRLGPCRVCGLSVCDQCGNIQHAGGERRPVHDACLRESGDAFSMIRFVK